MEEQGQSNQVAEMAKQQAEQIAKQTAQKAAKEVGKAALRVAKKAIMAAAKAAMQAIMAVLPYILIGVAIVLVVIMLIAGIKWLLDKETVASAAELMQEDISQYIKITDDKYEIDEKLYEKLYEKLDLKGMDGGAYLGKNSKYLKAIIKAELASSYPKLKDEKTNLEENNNYFQGALQLIRRHYNAEDSDRYYSGGEGEGDEKEILLTYKEPTEFNSEFEALKANFDKNKYNELRRFYTTKEDDLTRIIIPTYNGSSMGIQEISYTNNINKYIVPVEFLISQLEVTQNSEYVYNIADMAVNNSKIELVIQETYSYSYTHTVVNEFQSNKIVTVSDQKSESENVGIIKYIREVDSLVIKGTQKYIKNDTRYQEQGNVKYDEEGTFTYSKTRQVTYTSTPFNNKGTTVSSGNVTGESGDGYTNIYASSGGKNYRTYKQYIYKQVYGENNERANWLNSSGCGLVSAAIIISAYDTTITPTYLYDNYRAKDGHVNIDKYLQNSGLTFSYEESYSEEKLGQWLCDGNSSIVCLIGNAKVKGESWAGSSGHYITLLDGQGSSGNYQVYVSNPGRNDENKNGWYNLSEFSGVICKVYYISK